MSRILDITLLTYFIHCNFVYIDVIFQYNAVILVKLIYLQHQNIIDNQYFIHE